MMGCARTAEIQELLRLGHWPQAAGAELREHVRVCRACSERVHVTEVLRGMRASSMLAARLEPPALVWWRAQLRRRREVVQQVERPVRAQMFLVLAVVCVGLGLAFELSGGAPAWCGWLHAVAAVGLRSSVGSLGLGLVIASAAALAVMAGVTVYLSLDRE